MPVALFTSKNLIGDSLYVQPALEEWSVTHPGWDIDLLTLDDHISCLYEGMALPGNLRVVFDRMRKEYDFEFNFDVSTAFAMGDKEKIHISTAYGKMLGYDIAPRRVKYLVSDQDDHDKGLILLSLFSNSCASRKGKPPNKMLSWAHWIPTLTLLKQYGQIGVLGGPKDREIMGASLPISEEQYYMGLPLERVARMLRDARLLVTIDNGMGHLAATQGTPTILFYPECLSAKWIIPSGNDHSLMVWQMNPCTVDIPSVGIMVRQSLKRLLRS